MRMKASQKHSSYVVTAKKTILPTLASLGIWLSSTTLWAGDQINCNQGTCQSSWLTSQKSINESMVLGETYKKFIGESRTELQTVANLKTLAKDAGFKAWQAGLKLEAGARYYHINRDRAMMLIIGGKADISTGVRIVASHIDSPRLELKGRPVDSAQEFALFQTNYHGGIKTYQWTNIPLALTGHVDRVDGTRASVNIGLKPNDPIFMIPDLSPHTARDQMAKKIREAVTHEDLDPIIASGPYEKYSASQWVLKYLKSHYDINPADLVSAELSLVPAMPPRDMGFDRRLIAAYGQDDRLAAFTSFEAAKSLQTPPQTTIIYFSDNEETGNVNNTGASSTYLRDQISELLFSHLGSDFNSVMVSRTLRASKALSIDVNPAVNPMNPGAWEITNAPRLGYGVNIKLYGRGFNANSELIAWSRRAFDQKNIPWQTTTYKVGRAGGGTLGGEIARYNIDTIDIGVPLLSIHTPYAVSDKMDIRALRDAVTAFITYK